MFFDSHIHEENNTYGLIHIILPSFCGTLANSAEPDQMPQIYNISILAPMQKGMIRQIHITLDRRQSKTFILSTNADQKSLETEVSVGRKIAIESTVSYEL